jgi:hypothetical protein
MEFLDGSVKRGLEILYLDLIRYLSKGVACAVLFLGAMV